MTGKSILMEYCRQHFVEVCLAFTLTGITAVAFAQLPTATILGVIRDASGAVVPGASITARNSDTGQVRSAITAADGSFRISALPVGNYEVRSEHSGFQSAVRSGLVLTVSQEAVVDFTLQLGAVEQTVSVTAEAPLVNTTSGTLGSLVTEQRVEDLPLNGRNYMDLTLMQPGISNYSNKSLTGVNAMGTWYSSNGASVHSNTYLLDGAIANNAAGNSSAAADGTTLGIDGIREYRVITNAFSAEYGLQGGSQMMIATKGGTNQLHGSAFEYLRNSALDARNFFDYKSIASERRLPNFVRNQFGGSLGGPLKKDKTFVFGVFEGLRQAKGFTTIDNVPPVSAKVNGGVGGVPQIAPVIQPLLALFPDPNLPNNEFTYPFAQPISDTYGQVRVDQIFSTKDSLFARYTTQDSAETDPFSYPQFTLVRSSRSQFATLSESRVISPTLLSTARFSFSRTDPYIISPSNLIGPQYSFVPGAEIGSISITGITGTGTSAIAPSEQKQNIFTFSEDLFYTRGKHSLKFGALVNHYQQFLETTSASTGVLGFSNLSNFLLGQPLSESELNPGSITGRYWHYNTAGFYGQDDFRVLNNLTLNVGLRYEFQTVPNEVHGHEAALRNVQEDAATTVGPPYKNPSLLNFSPRFGFAWDVTGNGKTAIRGGFAELYDLGVLAQAMAIATTGTPPFGAIDSLTNPVGVLTLPLVFPPSAIGTQLRTVDYDVRQPHALDYNLTVERQLPAKMVLKLAYAGSRGLNLIQTTDGNPVVPQGMGVNGVCVPAPASVAADISRSNFCWTANNPRTNPHWSYMEFKTTGSSSWYNALQFSLERQFSHGLQFQSSYTWSKVIDFTQGEATGENTASSIYLSDPTQRSIDRSVADFDITQNWRLNAIYALPGLFAGKALGAVFGGWKASGLLSLSSGLPFTPVLNINRSLAGVGGATPDRPNLLPGFNSSNIIIGSPNQYFNPNAFSLQPVGFLGNAGRNILRGPGLANLDFSLVKEIAIKRLGEGGGLQFRAEFFNLLNRPNFSEPGQSLGTSATSATGIVPLATTGVITSTATTSRQIQIALRLHF